ncbi:MAG TPA: hypothetical protein VFM59_06645, partial [Salinimicrobium sp.]|nr:hypothetical protein [Salinimicrobium sp.]
MLKKALLFSLGGLALVLIIAVVFIKFLLPNVGEAPYLEIASSPERVEHGKYLANHVAVCMDCHSARDWKRYTGPLVPGTFGKGGEYFGPEMGFPGKFYAKNLTPIHLGNWSDGELFRAITTGVSKDGHALFPVMPYLYYGKMDEEDIYSIIAYLRTLEPIENEIPRAEVDFPMNLILNTIPTKAALTEIPNENDAVAYGAYLTNAASCIECHTQANKGNLNLEMAFAGGREFKLPNGIVRSANITPDKDTGIGNWNEEAFVARFKVFENTNTLREMKDGETNTIMPWSMFAGMKTSDLKAIYAYLQTRKPIKNKVSHFDVQLSMNNDQESI